MHGIVAFAVVLGLVIVVAAFVRSRPKASFAGSRPNAGAVRATRPEPEGFAEFVALVERETGRHLDLPPAAAAVARPAPRAPQPPSPKPKHEPVPTARKKRRPHSAPPEPPPLHAVAPPARPPLTALGVAPPLRRRRALAALAPLEPVAPLAPRAVRSP